MSVIDDAARGQALSFAAPLSQKVIVLAPAGYDHTRQRRLVVISNTVLNASRRVLVCTLATATGNWPIAVAIEPDQHNGLDEPAEILLGTIRTVRVEPSFKVIGHITDAQLDLAIDVLDTVLRHDAT